MTTAVMDTGDKRPYFTRHQSAQGPRWAVNDEVRVSVGDLSLVNTVDC